MVFTVTTYFLKKKKIKYFFPLDVCWIVWYVEEDELSGAVMIGSTHAAAVSGTHYQFETIRGFSQKNRGFFSSTFKKKNAWWFA